MTVSDARDLETRVAAAGTVATVPYVYRYHPLVREIRAKRENGELGRTLLIHGSYLQDWLVSPTSSTWRIDPARGGRSRAFADIGSHWVDLAEFVSGESFAETLATTSIAYASRPASSGPSFSRAGESADVVPVSTEDVAAVTLRSARGVLANTVISQVSAGRKNRLWFELDGTAGSAAFDQEQPDTLWLGAEDGSTIVHRGEGPHSADQARLNLAPAGHPQGWLDAFALFCADTYAALDGSTPNGLPTVSDGRRSVEVIEAVLNSAANGTWASIQTK